LVRAADSVAANLSEGLGRYHYKEVKNFSYYARGSLFETQTWLTKANQRNLVGDETLENLLKEIRDISVKLNNYIQSVGDKNKV
jgi:four helix bundle protein